VLHGVSTARSLRTSVPVYYATQLTRESGWLSTWGTA